MWRGSELMYETIRVTGSDPNGLDADRGGYGCE